MTTIQGFSSLNRGLLYANILLAPAQFISGIESLCPSSLGFLAFNLYSQIQWYQAVKAKELHALCMVLPHFTLTYALSYPGGVSSGSLFMSIPLGLITVGVMALNMAASWTGWATNMPEGYGSYEFFFFGWRTLTEDWHKFYTLWMVSDSIFLVFFMVLTICACIAGSQFKDNKWWYRYLAVPGGAVLAVFLIWPLIMWTELIIARNHIESATDWVAVWLFVAQVGTMFLPSFGVFKVHNED